MGKAARGWSIDRSAGKYSPPAYSLPDNKQGLDSKPEPGYRLGRKPVPRNWPGGIAGNAVRTTNNNRVIQ
jgi:hypothetical protein